MWVGILPESCSFSVYCFGEASRSSSRLGPVNAATPGIERRLRHGKCCASTLPRAGPLSVGRRRRRRSGQGLQGVAPAAFAPRGAGPRRRGRRPGRRRPEQVIAQAAGTMSGFGKCSARPGGVALRVDFNVRAPAAVNIELKERFIRTSTFAMVFLSNMKLSATGPLIWVVHRKGLFRTSAGCTLHGSHSTCPGHDSAGSEMCQQAPTKAEATRLGKLGTPRKHALLQKLGRDFPKQGFMVGTASWGRFSASAGAGPFLGSFWASAVPLRGPSLVPQNGFLPEAIGCRWGIPPPPLTNTGEF